MPSPCSDSSGSSRATCSALLGWPAAALVQLRCSTGGRPWPAACCGSSSCAHMMMHVRSCWALAAAAVLAGSGEMVLQVGSAGTAGEGARKPPPRCCMRPRAAAAALCRGRASFLKAERLAVLTLAPRRAVCCAAAGGHQALLRCRQPAAAGAVLPPNRWPAAAAAGRWPLPGATGCSRVWAAAGCRRLPPELAAPQRARRLQHKSWLLQARAGRLPPLPLRLQQRRRRRRQPPAPAAAPSPGAARLAWCAVRVSGGVLLAALAPFKLCSSKAVSVCPAGACLPSWSKEDKPDRSRSHCQSHAELDHAAAWPAWALLITGGPASSWGHLAVRGRRGHGGTGRGCDQCTLPQR